MVKLTDPGKKRSGASNGLVPDELPVQLTYSSSRRAVMCGDTYGEIQRSLKGRDPQRLRKLGFSYFRDNVEEDSSHPASIKKRREENDLLFTSQGGHDWRTRSTRGHQIRAGAVRQLYTGCYAGRTRYVHPADIPYEQGGSGPSLRKETSGEAASPSSVVGHPDIVAIINRYDNDIYALSQSAGTVRRGTHIQSATPSCHRGRPCAETEVSIRNQHQHQKWRVQQSSRSSVKCQDREWNWLDRWGLLENSKDALNDGYVAFLEGEDLAEPNGTSHMSFEGQVLRQFGRIGTRNQVVNDRASASKRDLCRGIGDTFEIWPPMNRDDIVFEHGEIDQSNMLEITRRFPHEQWAAWELDVTLKPALRRVESDRLVVKTSGPFCGPEVEAEGFVADAGSQWSEFDQDEATAVVEDLDAGDSQHAPEHSQSGDSQECENVDEYLDQLQRTSSERIDETDVAALLDSAIVDEDREDEEHVGRQELDDNEYGVESMRGRLADEESRPQEPDDDGYAFESPVTSGGAGSSEDSRNCFDVARTPEVESGEGLDPDPTGGLLAGTYDSDGFEYDDGDPVDETYRAALVDAAIEAEEYGELCQQGASEPAGDEVKSIGCCNTAPIEQDVYVDDFEWVDSAEEQP